MNLAIASFELAELLRLRYEDWGCNPFPKSTTVSTGDISSAIFWFLLNAGAKFDISLIEEALECRLISITSVLTLFVFFTTLGL